jgi:hypothetical protein
VEHELEVITTVQQAPDQFTPDAPALVRGKNGDGAYIGVEGAVGDGSREADERASVEGSAVRRRCRSSRAPSV